MQFNIIADWQ